MDCPVYDYVTILYSNIIIYWTIQQSLIYKNTIHIQSNGKMKEWSFKTGDLLKVVQ